MKSLEEVLSTGLVASIEHHLTDVNAAIIKNRRVPLGMAETMRNDLRKMVAVFAPMYEALLTDERGASLYSGASLMWTPPHKGSWLSMQRHGYRAVEVEIQIVRQL